LFRVSSKIGKQVNFKEVTTANIDNKQKGKGGKKTLADSVIYSHSTCIYYQGGDSMCHVVEKKGASLKAPSETIKSGKVSKLPKKRTRNLRNGLSSTKVFNPYYN
jgi:hypothetical protein